jgi:hypothetical protein
MSSDNSWVHFSMLPEDLGELQALIDQAEKRVNHCRRLIEQYRDTDVAKEYSLDLVGYEVQLARLREKHARFTMLLELPDLSWGTRVQVIKRDPMHSYACAHYPANGETGTVTASNCCPPGKQGVKFTGIFRGYDGIQFKIETEEDPDSFILFLSKDCFEAVE